MYRVSAGRTKLGKNLFVDAMRMSVQQLSSQAAAQVAGKQQPNIASAVARGQSESNDPGSTLLLLLLLLLRRFTACKCVIQSL